MSLSIINSVFALGAESAYLGTLGVRALEGDLGAALTAAAMAEAATDDSWSQALTVTDASKSQAPTVTADARRFGGSAADWCDCFRKPTALENLKARFDPDKKYSDEEKLELAKMLPEAMEDFTAQTRQRMQTIIDGDGRVEELVAWFEERQNWFCPMVDSLTSAVPTDICDFLVNDIVSSIRQVMGTYGAHIYLLKSRPTEISAIFGRMNKEVYLEVSEKKFRMPHSKMEMAKDLIYPLMKEATVSWEEERLVLALSSQLFPFRQKANFSLGKVAWPFNVDDWVMRTYLDILGWRITQEVAGDQVTLRIDFGASTYPKPDLMEEARRELWARFESLQGEMEVMKKELIRKIQSQEEALSIANWLAAETKRLKRVAGELGDLNKKLFQAGILEGPMRYAVSSFLHDKAIRDLDTLDMLAGSILDGATDRLEKILRYFASLPAGIKSLLERMTDDFYLRAAARGVSITSRCMEPARGKITQLVESVSLELVEGILANLVENGIKYSKPDEPRRNVVLIYNGDENVLEYTDNGIGMDPAFAARLGSELGLRELDRVGDVQGTGTGWPIIVHNLQALGWSYEIETAPGEGLKVRIRIPPEHLVQAG